MLQEWMLCNTYINAHVVPMEDKMLSHVNLVEAILASKQFDLSRRTGRSVSSQNSSTSFEAALTKNLHRSPSVLPLNNEISETDAKFNDALQFVMEKEGSKTVREDGGRETSRYGILQSTAREYGYKGNIKDISRADVEAIYRKLWEKSLDPRGHQRLPEVEHVGTGDFTQRPPTTQCL